MANRWKIAFCFGLVAALPVHGQGFDPGCALPFESIKLEHPIIDSSCGMDGSARGGGAPTATKLAENHAKNNFCLSGNPKTITYSTFLKLGAATADIKESDLTDRASKLSDLVTVNGKKFGEGVLVRYVAFVLHAKASDTKRGNSTTFGESVNCYRPSDEENDIHIMLARSSDEDTCQTVTGEMSPHFRPDEWTPDNLNALKVHPVRITGQLFFDSSHKPCHGTVRASPPRASVWEIHPIYAIEVCKGTSLQSCKTGPASKWVPLDQWASQDSDE